MATVSKRIVICLENEEGEHEEARIVVPAEVAELMNDSELFHPMLEDMFSMVGRTVLNIEMAEEVRTEFRRRWDDPKPV